MLRLRPFASSMRAARPMHVLVVPEHTLHETVTPYHNGVPVNQVRALKESEKDWEFWTSSNAFTDKDSFPSPFGFIHVPFGQTWVLKCGKALPTGVHFIAPLLQKVVAIKDSEMVTAGVLTPSCAAKNGQAVNAYAVAYFTVKDATKSAFYIDPITKKLDSERALSVLLRKHLEVEIKNFDVNEEGMLSNTDSDLLAAKLLQIVTQKCVEFGLEVSSIDVRGAFPTQLMVPTKLRALEMPPRDANAFGAQLSNDYWADVITPPFFEKLKFGGRKEYKTESSNNLVWSIPSPPDFHHFNHVPRMTESVAAEVTTKV